MNITFLLNLVLFTLLPNIQNEELFGKFIQYLKFIKVFKAF